MSDNSNCVGDNQPVRSTTLNFSFEFLSQAENQVQSDLPVGIQRLYANGRQAGRQLAPQSRQLDGGLAQLVERLPCTEKVSGSNPLASNF
jgi:hypothetical protein